MKTTLDMPAYWKMVIQTCHFGYILYSLVMSLTKIILFDKGGGRDRIRTCLIRKLGLDMPTWIRTLGLKKYSLTVASLMDSIYIFREIWMLNVYFWRPEKGCKVIDIGAHIGFYSVKSAELVGNDGLVISIEPHPLNYRFLTANIKANKLQNVLPVNIALSDSEGDVKLFVSERSGEHSLFLREGNEFSGEYIIVKIRTLDSLLKDLGIDHVDLIKIDAEGAELPILRGATRTLEQEGLRLAIAAYHTEDQADRIGSFLGDRNFTVRRLSCSKDTYLIANKR